MVIDYEVLCDSLDISHEALLRGSNTYAREIVKLCREYGPNNFPREKELAIYMKLPNDELVALIRRRNLHKGWPEYFTWDGPTEKAEKELKALI